MGSYNLKYGAVAHNLTNEDLEKLHNLARKRSGMFHPMEKDHVDDLVAKILFDSFNQWVVRPQKREHITLTNQVFQTAKRDRYYARFNKAKRRNDYELKSGYHFGPVEQQHNQQVGEEYLAACSQTTGNYSSDPEQSVENELFLDCLIPIQKQVFKMHLDNFTSDEIAEEIGKSSRQVRRILAAARENLQQEWALAA